MFNEVYEKRKIRPIYSPVLSWAKSLPESTILKRKSEAENLFKKIAEHSSSNHDKPSKRK